MVFDFYFDGVTVKTGNSSPQIPKKVTKVVLIVSMIYVVSWFPQLILYLLSHFLESFEFGVFPYIASLSW